MPRTVTTGLYDFDPLMKNSDNQIFNEKQVLTLPNRDDFHFLIPQASPFFVSSLVVRNETTGETYEEGVDYVVGHWFVEAMQRTGRPIAGSVRFLRRDTAGIISFDYRTLGGEWGFDEDAIVRELSQKSINPLVRAWAQIDVLPHSFPPVPHDQIVDDLIGFEEIVDAVGEIAGAITQTREGEYGAHLTLTNNPHRVNKEQVGLGNVLNYPPSSMEEAASASRDDRYMTPRTTREVFESVFMPMLDDHKDDQENPHGVTAEQLGLGYVYNYPMAGDTEAEEANRDDRYMSPRAVRLTIDTLVSPKIDDHIGDFDNPHGVTKAQVGLDKVENFTVADRSESESGSRDDRYMTPRGTSFAIENQVGLALQSHLDNTNNPHNVTPDQIGAVTLEDFEEFKSTGGENYLTRDDTAADSELVYGYDFERLQGEILTGQAADTERVFGLETEEFYDVLYRTFTTSRTFYVDYVDPDTVDSDHQWVKAFSRVPNASPGNFLLTLPGEEAESTSLIMLHIPSNGTGVKAFNLNAIQPSTAISVKEATPVAPDEDGNGEVLEDTIDIYIDVKGQTSGFSVISMQRYDQSEYYFWYTAEYDVYDHDVEYDFITPELVVDEERFTAIEEELTRLNEVNNELEDAFEQAAGQLVA